MTAVARMECDRVRPLAADQAAGRLDPDRRAAVDAHLDGCAACREATAVEAALNDALGRLPRHRAPASLKRQVERLLADAAAARPPVQRAVESRSRRAWPTRWAAPLAAALASGAVAVLVMRFQPTRTEADPSGALVTEVVNDHLRVVSSTHPADVESGGIHQVKPWFTGRLDFAPRVAFAGDDEFPLVGGSLGYLRDRKAALFLFKRRLHSITLMVFLPDGLPWPSAPGKRLGRAEVTEVSSRGFSVLLWRDDGLGYALVSDVNVRDLEQLAAKLAPDGQGG